VGLRARFASRNGGIPVSFLVSEKADEATHSSSRATAKNASEI
jgi:hypothetical protein